MERWSFGIVNKIGKLTVLSDWLHAGLEYISIYSCNKLIYVVTCYDHVILKLWVDPLSRFTAAATLKK